MAFREISYPQSAWIEDLKDETGNPNGRLEIVAQDVVIAKAEAACEAMILLAALRMKSGSQWNAITLRYGAAQVQKTKALSTADFKQQAAHLLPGNIIVNGTNSWSLATRIDKSVEGTRLAAQLQAAFANTMNLPACFNIADSRAEMGNDGLKNAFVGATQAMSNRLKAGTGGAFAFRQAIDDGLKYWFFHTNQAYQAAAARKKAAAQAASSDEKQRRLLEYRVLAEYERSFKARNPMRCIYSQAGLASLLQRYENTTALTA